MKTMQRTLWSVRFVLRGVVSCVLFLSVFFFASYLAQNRLFQSTTSESKILIYQAQNGAFEDDIRNNVSDGLSSTTSASSAHEHNDTDLVIFSFDRPLQLYALLESIERYMRGLAAVYVIYRVSNEQYSCAYDQVHAGFPTVHFCKQGDKLGEDFKGLTLRSSFSSTSSYILFAVDDIIVKNDIDLNECIRLLEQHNAYGFFFRLGTHLDFCYSCNAVQLVPPLVEVSPCVYSWTFCQGTYDWNYPHTVDMTLYRKADVVPYFHAFEYRTPNQLEGVWGSQGGAVACRTGLCYAHSKVVNVPLNRVQSDYPNRYMDRAMTTDDLLRYWHQGLKIDIEPLQHIDNKAAHMDYEPTFITRRMNSVQDVETIHELCAIS